MHLATLTEQRLPGRKRKSGRRKACGRLEQADKRPDDRLKVARQPHRRELAGALPLDERAESALGRALLRKSITDAEYNAGVRYAVVAGEYRASIHVPRTTAGAGRGYDCNPDWCSLESYRCECQARRNRYYRAWEALHDCGRHVLWQVVYVAIEDQEPVSLPHLRAGLKALAEHFGYC